MKKQVKDLQVGDVLTASGAIIMRAPYPEDNPREGKNKVRIGVHYPNSKYDHEVKVWGKYTVVGVQDKTVSAQ